MEFRGKGRGKPWNSMEKAVESRGIPWKRPWKAMEFHGNGKSERTFRLIR